MGQNITQKELQKRLQSLEANSPDQTAMFAVRCALRAFPRLFGSVHFPYWSQKNKINNILITWRALLIAYLGQEDLAEIAYREASGTATEASDDNSVPFVAYNDYAAAIIHAAAYAAKATTDGAYSASLASGYAVESYRAPEKPLNGIIVTDLACLEDLHQLELKEKLNVAHLWLVETPSRDKKILNNEFPSILKRLVENRDVAVGGATVIIQNIYALYMSIYNGSPDMPALKQALLDVHTFLAKNLHIKTLSENYCEEQVAQKDSLGREPLVNALKNLLVNKNNNGYRTIGLLGNWGVGKSSFLEFLSQALIKDSQPFLFAKFNAWEYEHTNNLQAGIAQEMIKGLSQPCYTHPLEQKSSGWLLDRVQEIEWFCIRIVLTLKFAMSIHGWRMLWPLALFLVFLMPLIFEPVLAAWIDTNFIKESGILIWHGSFLLLLVKELKRLLANPLAKEFLTYLKLPNYGEYLGLIPVMRDNIKKLTEVRLQKFGRTKRMLYIVDDLDRCNPENIVKVLEAVKLVLDIPGVTVIIAVDYRIALSALALHYKDLQKFHAIANTQVVAREYLEKIWHMSIFLQKQKQKDTNTYLLSLWENKKILSSQALLDHKHELINKSEGVRNNITTQATPELSSSGEVNNETILKDEKLDSADLSDAQKMSFRFLLDYFEITNPRKIKRLDNTYTLLQNFYGYDKEVNMAKASRFEDFHCFPLMLTLFSLEYINNIENEKVRNNSIAYLLGDSVDSEDIDQKIVSAIRDVLLSINNMKDHLSLVDAVTPFVLPPVYN